MMPRTAPRVLLTGGSGGLGEAVIRRLAREGVGLVALARAPAALRRIAGDAAADLTPIWGDVSLPFCGLRLEDLPRLRGVTHVIHAAADTRWHAAPGELQAANVEGLQNLLDLCVLAGLDAAVSITHVSSAYVCGRDPGLREAPLEAPPRFNNAYEASKYLGERVALAWSRHRVRVVRPSTIVGDSVTGRATRFRGLYYFLERIWRDALPVAPGAPGNRLDIVPADYVADFLRPGARPADDRPVVHAVAGPRGATLAEIWSLSTAAFNAADPSRRRRPGVFVPLWAAQPLLSLAGGIPGPVGAQARRTRRFLSYAGSPKAFEAPAHLGVPAPAFRDYGPRICEQAARAGFRSERPSAEPQPRASRRRDEGTILLTGASGFLGGAIARRLVRDGHAVVAVCRGRTAGVSQLAAMERQGLLRLVRGDLSQPGWGCEPAVLRDLARDVRTVVHAAGAYDLAIAAAAAEQGNTSGARNLLAEVRGWGLAAFHHVSSITVAGRTDGVTPEAEIRSPGPFRNAYERSKWEAERLVVAASLPTRIYRPGIIVGDSVTGATAKFDGPYPAFALMRPGAPFPIAGGGGEAFPLVNVDLVADAVVAGLAQPPQGVEVVHAIDTDPLSLREFAEAMCRRLAGHGWVLPLPSPLVEAAIRFPGVGRLTGVQPQSIAYMHSFGRFETQRFRDLCAAGGIPSARLRGSLDALALHYGLSKRRALHPVPARGDRVPMIRRAALEPLRGGLNADA